jgi:YD repeat-containing protein
MLSLLAGCASAGVNMKNGNFYISYTDIIVGDLEITRTYNSKSTGSTVMGYGWGFGYAQRVSFPVDGVTLHNHGLGSLTYLRFQGGGGDGVIKRSDYADALLAAGNCATVLDAESLLSRLVANREERESFLTRGFSVSNDVHPLFSGSIAFQPGYLCKNPDCKMVHGGYTLFSQDRVVMGDWGGGAGAQFSRDGVLLEVCDGKAPSRKVVRDVTGKIAMIHQGADHIRFFYDENGNLCRMVGSNGVETELQIDSEGDLIYSRDTGDNEYWYEYDDEHNLTRIGYDADDPSNEMRITYVESGICGSVRDPSGQLWEYRYGSNPDRPNNNYWTEVTQVPQFSPPVENKYEYFIAIEAGGVSRTARIISTVDGVTSATTYDSNGTEMVETDASAPFRKVEDGGLIHEVVGPVHGHLLTHDPEGKHLTGLEITDLASGQEARWTYGYSNEEGRRIIKSVTDGKRMLEISTHEGVTSLKVGDSTALIGNGGRVSMDGETWYGIGFKRKAKDGLLLAVLTGADGQPVEVPELEGLLNICRAPIGASARQFLPLPLHEVRWYSFDL